MSSLDRSTSKIYWRSLAELQDTPEFRAFAEAEFPHEADPSGISRRRWLQIMGASLALAGAAGCETDPQFILPFAKRPEGWVPGKRERYATAMDVSGSAIGLLVTCVDGRPIKVEGNERHPFSLGATNVFAQAAVLELYDPDRSRQPVEKGPHGGIAQRRGAEQTPWRRFDDALRRLVDAARKSGGEGFCVLAEPCSSPTLGRLRHEFLTGFPKARWFEYEPLTDDNERAGAVRAFGRPYRAHFDLSRARVIVCLEADLLGSHPAALRYARQFAQGRPGRDQTMNRLYAVECVFSLTGVAADHRLPLPRREIAAFVARLVDRIERLARGEKSPIEPTGNTDDFSGRFLDAIVEDLWRNRGQSVVAVGPEQPPEVHAAVHRLNAVLGNVGKTVRYTETGDADRSLHVQAISELTDAMRNGQVSTLLIFGGNPAYDAPADLEFAAALDKVTTSIHCSLYRNETSLRCHWHVPQAHFLESWSDTRAYDGTYSVVQPLIQPLHGGRTWIELLAKILGDPTPDGRQLVRMTFRQLAGARDSEKLWRKTLHDGLLEGSAWVEVRPPEPEPVALPVSSAKAAGGVELIFCRDASVYDGRFANSSWLQECPDPITKLTWDNAAVLSPATARQLGVENETLVRLTVSGRSVEIPACIVPGQAQGTIAVNLGYGRTAAGAVGGAREEKIGTVGVDVYPLRTTESLHAADADVRPTGIRYPLATTQDHFVIDPVGFERRQQRVGELIREADLQEYRKTPDFAKHVVHVPPLESLWQEHSFEGPRWGMAIDLSKCIGCNACVVACQAENNIPVVGKEQVLRGREMHWLRVDRYFQGQPDSEDVRIAVQPLACHHCELAPCEQVCPVAATVHSQEGLNDMVYNRCIGTRYCANNCPYKVRRFNYFDYHKDLQEPDNATLKMVYNPDVTIRSRGVMEKCTYCVQRIQAAKIAAGNENRAVRDGEIQTACQQACPTQAIVFGDLADPEADVTHWHADDRSYAILAELNVKPRTAYLARIRNPHPKLKTADEHRRTHG